jgi:ribosome-binding protein aMBF1 (putative translation factor)
MLLSETSGSSENNEVKKRGRKPKTTTNYFAEREEHAVRMFLSACTETEKNEIYNEYLRAPLDKMIESIIRRYKLYRKDMDFREIHHDTHSFLITKVDKFKPARNKKAYSYFGTICKNYLMGQIIKDQKETNRKISYEDISSSLENRPDMIYYLEYEKVEPDQIINEFLTKLKDFISGENLNTNEKKLGFALIELFDNYDEIFIGTDNNKFNKNIILLSLREMTNLSTKEIRTSMKKFKILYYDMMKIINNR